MALYIIGIGLSEPGDITERGLEAMKKCEKLYLDSYTSKLMFPVEELEKLCSKKIILADREMVEQKPEETILKEAKQGNTAFLVVGDALAATTHIDLMLRAKKAGIDVEIIHNASVFTAVSQTGLQLYKFGKAASIPFAEGEMLAETPYNVLKKNQSIDAHTLFMLDLNPKESRYMTVADAIKHMLKVEERREEKVFSEQSLCIGCARLGSKEQKIIAGTAAELLKADFGKAPHCLITLSKLHFMEEEAIKRLN